MSLIAMDSISPVYSSLQELLISNQVYRSKSVNIMKLILQMENSIAYNSPAIFQINRPRGFGLSLVAGTLQRLMNRHVNDEYINKIDDIQLLQTVPKRSTIAIDFKHFKARDLKEFSKNLLDILQELFWKNHIESQYAQYETPKSYFKRLLSGIYELQNSQNRDEMCMVIDNYDVPLYAASFLPEHMVQDAVSMYLDMLNVIKYSKQYLKWVLLTGHIKFTLATEFSEGLPLTNDVSNDQNYASLFGLSRSAVADILSLNIEKFANMYNVTEDEYIDLLEKCYGGFRFSDSETKMLCPACIYHVINNSGKLLPYSASGNYAFLKRALKANNGNLSWLYNKDGQDPVFADTITHGNVKGKMVGSLLTQLGFATRVKVLLNIADSYTTWRYRFNFPNLDMKYTLDYLTGAAGREILTRNMDITQILESEDD